MTQCLARSRVLLKEPLRKQDMNDPTFPFRLLAPVAQYVAEGAFGPQMGEGQIDSITRNSAGLANGSSCRL